MPVSTSTRAVRVLCAIAVGAGVLLLAGCGGGGGSSTTPNLASAPGDAAITSYYTTASQASLSGPWPGAGGGTCTAQLSLSPSSAKTAFNGIQNVSSAIVATTLTCPGTSSSATQTSYFTTGPFKAIGAELPGGLQYEVMPSWAALPTMIAPGQGGTLGTSTTWQNKGMTARDGTNAYSYQVNALSPTAVQLCIIDAFTATPPNPDNLASFTQTTCFAVTAAGVATLDELAVTAGGVTITLK